MDIADRAQRLEEIERSLALARGRGATSPSQSVGTASAFACDGCGDEIPQARRQLLKGVRLCTHCANQVERYGRLRGG